MATVYEAHPMDQLTIQAHEEGVVWTNFSFNDFENFRCPNGVVYRIRSFSALNEAALAAAVFLLLAVPKGRRVKTTDHYPTPGCEMVASVRCESSASEGRSSRSIHDINYILRPEWGLAVVCPTFNTFDSHVTMDIFY